MSRSISKQYNAVLDQSDQRMAPSNMKRIRAGWWRPNDNRRRCRERRVEQIVRPSCFDCRISDEAGPGGRAQGHMISRRVLPDSAAMLHSCCWLCFFSPSDDGLPFLSHGSKHLLRITGRTGHSFVLSHSELPNAWLAIDRPKWKQRLMKYPCCAMDASLLGLAAHAAIGRALVGPGPCLLRRASHRFLSRKLSKSGISQCSRGPG